MHVLLIISIMLVINTPVSYFIEKLKIERKERNNQIVDIEDSKIKVTSLEMKLSPKQGYSEFYNQSKTDEDH